MSMFFSAYRQFRKSSGEVEKLHNRIQELTAKVIRGAPCPKGFEIEVDERQRIVLAKPGRWEQRGGTIFDFELPKDKLQKGDIFPARMEVGYGPVMIEEGSADVYYEKTAKLFETPIVGFCTTEFINVGGEPNAIKSLKVIAQLYAKVTITKNPLTGKDEIGTVFLSKQDFDDARASAESPPTSPPASALASNQTPAPDPPPVTSVASSAAPEVVRYLTMWQMQVVCLHAELKKVFVLNFYDDEKDFTQSSAVFNHVIDSVRFLS
jgi:hypothetical protein